jgi:hypothetical protein
MCYSTFDEKISNMTGWAMPDMAVYSSSVVGGVCR